MLFDQLRRREFITLLGGAAASWPLAARAQQPALPVVGFIRDGSAEANARYAAAFGKGLNETGTVEGQNVTVEYHWLKGQARSLADIAGRSRTPTGGRDRHGRQRPHTGGQSCNRDDPDRLRCRRRPVRLCIVASFARPGNFPAANSCIWPRALPRCRPCRASHGRKPIRRGRCV